MKEMVIFCQALVDLPKGLPEIKTNKAAVRGSHIKSNIKTLPFLIILKTMIFKIFLLYIIIIFEIK